MLQRAVALRGGADDQTAIGYGIGDRRIFARALQDVLRFHGRLGFTKRDFVWIYQTQFGDAEIAHRARSRADIEGIARRGENDSEQVHGKLVSKTRGHTYWFTGACSRLFGRRFLIDVSSRRIFVNGSFI